MILNRNLTKRLMMALTLALTASPLAVARMSETAQTPDIKAAPPMHWQLTWQESFNHGQKNLKGWHYDLGGNGWGNNEDEVYTHSRDNVFVAHGHLNIMVIGKRRHGTVHYTSGRITTRNIFSQRYGLFVFRARLPKGRGLWPAIWMMPKKSVYGGWPRSGEIDIMESRGNWIHHVQGSLHSGNVWNQDNTQTKIYRLPQGETTTQWHTYALRWEPARDPHHPGRKIIKIQWYVDGHLYETRQGGWTVPNSAPKGSLNAPFNRRFYIILNMAVGGNYVGGKTPGPGRYDMQIDYIRAYRLAPDGG
ncbi:MAG: glycoside hydrolase family 16 protein [Phycisphaerae bacterium]